MTGTMSIIAPDFDTLYRATLVEVLTAREASPRGMNTREILGAQLVLTNPLRNILSSPARKLNYRFSVAEWLWMLLGQNDTSVAVFNSQLRNFSDDGETFAGAYGPKLAEQLPYVLDCLRQDSFSRQAVLTIWRERPRASKDIPCTVAMQFFIRENKLHMITTMRSNDVFLGLPYDLFNFTQIQNYLAGVLCVDIGEYVHNVGSLHVYEQHYEKCATIIEETTRPLESPRLPSLSSLNDIRREYNTLTYLAGTQVHQTMELVEWYGSFADPWPMYLKVLASKWNRGLIPYIEEPYYGLLA